VGVLICYDNNIVENARANALLGAEVLLAPHQTGGATR
jgi:predicted amidohydrolase